MSNDDNALASALWLLVGGAAGYAAGRFVVGPRLAKAQPLASRSTGQAARPLRALAGPPVDPYGPGVIAVGSTGEMRPIDPYLDDGSPRRTSNPLTGDPSDPYATDVQPAASIPAPSSAPPSGGPITRPSQVGPTPITRAPELPPSSRGPITMPSQIDASNSTDAPTAPRTTTTPSAVPAPGTTSARMPARAPGVTPSPTVTATPARGVFATTPRVRRFDPVFARYRGDLPIEYVRALVERESDGLPTVRTGVAIGLMQIVPVVLTDYNKRHGTAYGDHHLTDPAFNVAIGCELLRLIIASYRKNHPRIASLQADWNNLRFVELLTLGWNAGFSEAGGLGRVARYLEQLGVDDLDVDLVSAHAKAAGATKHLSDPAKLAWTKSVAALYQRERALASS